MLWLWDGKGNKKETKVSETKADVNCDFIASLTAKQKDELRKLLDEDAKANMPMTVGFLTRGTRLVWLQEYKNEKRHGKYMQWYSSGNKAAEIEYVNGLMHGKSITFDEESNKTLEAEYQNGVLVK